jgi:transposase-like protein
MNEQTVVEKKRNSPPRGAGGAKTTRRYSPADKLRAVRLHLTAAQFLDMAQSELSTNTISVLKAKAEKGDAKCGRFCRGERAAAIHRPG